LLIITPVASRDGLNGAGVNNPGYAVGTPGPVRSVAVRGHVVILAFSTDGTRVGLGWKKGDVGVWDVAAGGTTRFPGGHAAAVFTVAFSSGAGVLASGSADQAVMLWDAATGRRRAVLEGHAGEVTTLAFSPDDRLLASGSSDATVRLWFEPLSR
jgi:WD40 repeat protein